MAPDSGCGPHLPTAPCRQPRLLLDVCQNQHVHVLPAAAGAAAEGPQATRGLTSITRHRRSTGKAPRCSSTNGNLRASGLRRTGWIFLGYPSPPLGCGSRAKAVPSFAQARDPRGRPHPCRGARSPTCSRSTSRRPAHPQPDAANARSSARSVPHLCEIHPSCLCPWLISLAARYVIKGAAPNRDWSIVQAPANRRQQSTEARLGLNFHPRWQSSQHACRPGDCWPPNASGSQGIPADSRFLPINRCLRAERHLIGKWRAQKDSNPQPRT